MRDLLKDKAICDNARSVDFIRFGREIASHAVNRAIAAEKENAELRQRMEAYKKGLEMIWEAAPVGSINEKIAKHALVYAPWESNQGEETKG